MRWRAATWRIAEHAQRMRGLHSHQRLRAESHRFMPHDFTLRASAMLTFWHVALPNALAMLSALGHHQLAHLLRDAARALRQRTTRENYLVKFDAMRRLYVAQTRFAQAVEPQRSSFDSFPPVIVAMMEGMETIWTTCVGRFPKPSAPQESIHQRNVREAGESIAHRSRAVLGSVAIDERHRGFMDARGLSYIISPQHRCAVKKLNRYWPARSLAYYLGHDIVDAVEIPPAFGEKRALIVVTRPTRGKNLKAHRLWLPSDRGTRRGDVILPADLGEGERKWQASKISMGSAMKHGGHSWERRL